MPDINSNPIPNCINIAGASFLTIRMANQLRQQLDLLMTYKPDVIMKFNRSSATLLKRSVMITERIHMDLRDCIVRNQQENDPEWKRLDEDAIKIISTTLELLETRIKVLKG